MIFKVFLIFNIVLIEDLCKIIHGIKFLIRDLIDF